ncbi:serine/threonine-protein kinase [Pseudochelatococcus contaminans]|uniref:Serine/threonine protein kinase n=1 Tax=Pseudochelatococcus contaminans TaxID=1538103 RepID=A0A7W5Z184_9HYPH|nr:serine/threonine-protein kinase [Pseudochelatococcus contaminans]MBB3808152.1 serine/threonine protein kinase [Pseudochelatococcus contaminans]
MLAQCLQDLVNSHRIPYKLAVDLFDTALAEGAAPPFPAADLDAALAAFHGARLRRHARTDTRMSDSLAPARMHAQEPPTIGHLLRDRFVLDTVLGRGGMGTVYRAVDRRRLEAGAPQPYVALKLLNGPLANRPEALAALGAETRSAQELAHPNIVTVHDCDRDGPHPFIVMEWLRGSSLKTVLHGDADFVGSQRAYRAVVDLCAGLAYAHYHGVAHADLKPGNLFLCENGRLKILDFGISSKVLSDQREPFDRSNFAPNKESPGENRSAQIRPGSMKAATEDGGDVVVVLTPAFTSPERICGRGPSLRDDIYALGCLVHLMLNGRHPFNRMSAVEARERRLVPPALPSLGASARRVVDLALSFDENLRPADAGAFLDAFSSGARRDVLQRTEQRLTDHR